MRKALIPLALLAGPVLAQDVAPLTEPETELAFETEKTRMTVPVSVAGAGPYRFIIDTGAQRTMISRQLAAELNLPRGRRVGLTAMTGRAQVDTVLVPSLQVSSFGGERIEAPTLERAHMGAPGILGIDTLQDHAVAIDFDQGVMKVSPSKKRKGRARVSRDEVVVVAKSLFGQLVVTDATYGNKRIRVIVDTGTEVSMGNEALRRLISRSKAPEQDIELVSVIGDKLVAGYTQIPRVKIGTVEFENLPVAFSAAAPFEVWGLKDKPALLLGMDALRMFRQVHIDFANRELRLTMPKNVRRV
ncbi:aspartyl protease family protein [Sphingomonas lenta]|uniref:Peptidase A2 domain-containing protein n=1 Tax=Sphingomonas lenta TaxID=1141887 RepID=A0A2A2SEX7_9SPHN|nr:aspartyl protease family protein [Sphingomonas lenta]PAX07561.1 hypothetical protein CKY28_07830 [Sphingomonas lenta]